MRTLARTLLGFMAMAAVANANTGPPPDAVTDNQPVAEFDAQAQPPDKPSCNEGTVARDITYQGEAATHNSVATDPISGLARCMDDPVCDMANYDADGICSSNTYTGAARASPTTLSSETAVLMHDPDEEGNGWTSTTTAWPTSGKTPALTLLGDARTDQPTARRNC